MANNTAARVHLIRHATPDWSRKDIAYHIPPGPPLCEQGLMEARQLADFVKDLSITHFRSSPLERCLRTATIAALSVRMEVTIEPALMEVQPQENREDIVRRAAPILEQAYQHSLKHGAVALVTHGGVIHSLLSWMGMSDAELNRWKKFDHGNPVPPAGVWSVEKDTNGQWIVELIFTPLPVV